MLNRVITCSACLIMIHEAWCGFWVKGRSFIQHVASAWWFSVNELCIWHGRWTLSMLAAFVLAVRTQPWTT
jgi:hypothetical protein